MKLKNLTVKEEKLNNFWTNFKFEKYLWYVTYD